jgi:ketose-bisphosphate aldolase
MLDEARAGHYAVGTFTVVDMNTARGVFEAFDLEAVPAAAAVTKRMVPFMDFEGLTAYLVARANAASTPVAIHLDHATDLDLVRRALDAGFTSVQYDAVNVDFTHRIELTRVAAELAGRYGATVEAELDHIGRSGVEAGGSLTDPTQAAIFASETGIDVLAVSIGTTHGLASGEAHIDLSRLAEIRAATQVQLALHGGTGVAPDQLVAASDAGITKVSYFHGMALDAVRALQKAIPNTPHGMLATLLDQSLRATFRDRCRQMLRTYGGPRRAPNAGEALALGSDDLQVPGRDAPDR